MSQSIELHPDPPAAPIGPGGHRLPAALLAAAADLAHWQQRALCAQTDPDAFFPEQGASTAEAKAVCARCPVTAECLEHVLAHDERFGVWAGMS
ncbi:WhiB family transcriptional regulator, partial [Actinomycetospora atypica]